MFRVRSTKRNRRIRHQLLNGWKPIVAIIVVAIGFTGAMPASAQSDPSSNFIKIGDYHLMLCELPDAHEMRDPLNTFTWEENGDGDGRSARTRISRNTLSAWSVSPDEIWMTDVGGPTQEFYLYGESAQIKSKDHNAPKTVDVHCLSHFREFPFMAMPPSSCPSDYMKAIEIFGGRIGMWTPETNPGVNPAVVSVRVAEEMIFMLPYKTFARVSYPGVQIQPIFGPGTMAYAPHGAEVIFTTKCTS